VLPRAFVPFRARAQLDGVLFPNTRGASFYRVNDRGKLVYARDIVESPVKLGSIAFFLLRLLTPLVRLTLKGDSTEVAARTSVGDEASPSSEKQSQKRSIESYAYFSMAVIYVYVLLLSPNGSLIPGDAAWQIRQAQIDEVIGCSTDFFFLLSALGNFGVHPPQVSAELHPMTKGLFNFAEVRCIKPRCIRWAHAIWQQD